MPRVTRERVTRERVERPSQAFDELLQRKRGDPGGSQLERQRNPIQPFDDGQHPVRVKLGRGVRRPRPRCEHFGACGRLEPAQWHDLLAGSPKRLAGGRKDPQVRTA